MIKYLVKVVTLKIWLQGAVGFPSRAKEKLLHELAMN